MKNYYKSIIDKNRNFKNNIAVALLILLISTMFSFISKTFDPSLFLILFFVYLSIYVIFHFWYLKRSNNLMDIFCYVLEEEDWDYIKIYLDMALNIHITIKQEPVSMYILGYFYLNKNLTEEGKELIKLAIEKEPELKKIKPKFTREDSNFLFELRNKNKKRVSKIKKRMEDYEKQT
ncbi:MAG: hypothetical protein GY714_29625 [Desulfobacterales bacterium]|nr:hypothetical protein [Desulfobacterales bacterium]